MSDLRTGLVEAIAQGIAEVTGESWEMYLVEADFALNHALGFLTDNAEGWHDNAEGWHDEAEGWHDEHGQLPDIFDLIAALSDSRDTGDSP